MQFYIQNMPFSLLLSPPLRCSLSLSLSPLFLSFWFSVCVVWFGLVLVWFDHFLSLFRLSIHSQFSRFISLFPFKYRLTI